MWQMWQMWQLWQMWQTGLTDEPVTGVNFDSVGRSQKTLRNPISIAPRMAFQICESVAVIHRNSGDKRRQETGDGRREGLLGFFGACLEMSTTRLD